ncbi:MAG TPA: hypothetical protein VL463_21005 [Kofleriaceae bacterium]|nr:hypothetical protein [Kofleriaceae bacterium]
MSQRFLVGLSSVIFAFGCSHENKGSQRPVASAGMNANAQVGENTGAGAGAYGQVGPVEAGGNAQLGANKHGVYGGVGAEGDVDGTGGYANGSAAISRDDQATAGLACPMDVPGVKVALGEVKGAIVLDFTTNGDVMELRTRVHKLAEPQNNAAMANDSAAGDTQGSGGREMHHDVAHIDARATTQDLPNGIRVIFTPADAGQLDALRAQTQLQVSQLNQGDCSGLEINGHQLRGRNNGRANRVPSTYDEKGPNQPTPAPNQATSPTP